ncbi:hypothetical protein T492DRAFT_965796 [Pavlovales sp. CCMP2436]|nr:hypothetical protein T492DRAFT_965796 [Pavlovales sp. CCMP2436]
MRDALLGHGAFHDALEERLGCPPWSVILFAGLSVVYLTLQVLQRATVRPSPTVPSGDKGDAVGSEREFRAFQWRWGVVYATIMLADWLQGTHMYALYSSYGLSKDNIGNLFIAGFASGAVFSTVIGPFVDRFGRKAGCVLYCVLEILINALEHFDTMPPLLVGRVLGGISTSLLFSAFEAWLVSEHRARKFPEQWLERIFSLNGALNGITAIAAGLLAQFLTVNLGMGNIGPFRGAIALTVLALFQILPWDENYGDRTAEVSASLRLAVGTMSRQPSLWLLGIVQSLFEGAMYTFVFNWVPLLEPLAPQSKSPFPHGLVFACFMLCIASGSSIFELAGRRLDSRHILALTLLVATIGLATPVLATSFAAVLGSFCVFEACCGAFGPGCATLRSRVIPSNIHSTVLNLYRITLNLAVVAGTKGSTVASSNTLFAACALALALATACQVALNADPRVRSAAEVAGKSD